MCKLAKYVRNCVVFWKIYTDDKNFTRPPVATVATNSKSVCVPFEFCKCLLSLFWSVCNCFDPQHAATAASGSAAVFHFWSDPNPIKHLSTFPSPSIHFRSETVQKLLISNPIEHISAPPSPSIYFRSDSVQKQLDSSPIKNFTQDVWANLDMCAMFPWKLPQ